MMHGQKNIKLPT